MDVVKNNLETNNLALEEFRYYRNLKRNVLAASVIGGVATIGLLFFECKRGAEPSNSFPDFKVFALSSAVLTTICSGAAIYLDKLETAAQIRMEFALNSMIRQLNTVLINVAPNVPPQALIKSDDGDGM